ncbi:hypothetical protein ACJZ2D_016086 [Fusarium nematophilum]
MAETRETDNGHAAYIVTIAVAMFYCWPIESNWSLDPTEACPPIKLERIFQVAWVLHFAGDLMIFALPWSIITKLQMGRSMKMGVFCTFLLGIVNMVFCLVRFTSVQTAAVDSSAPLSLIILWSALDTNIGLVIACLPALRPFFRRKESRDYYESGSGRYRGIDPGAVEAGHGVTRDPYARELGPDSPVNASSCIRPNSDIDLPVQSVFPEDETSMVKPARQLEDQQQSFTGSTSDFGFAPAPPEIDAAAMFPLQSPLMPNFPAWTMAAKPQPSGRTMQQPSVMDDVDLLCRGLVGSGFGSDGTHILSCSSPEVMMGMGDPMVYSGYDGEPMQP